MKPFTYAAFQATETDLKAQIFPLTDHNMLPAMVLWLALTLDIGGQYTEAEPGHPNPGIDEKAFTALARHMGLTPQTAASMLKLREGSIPLASQDGQASLQDVFAATSAVFSKAIGLHGNGPEGYDGPYCPTTLNGLVRLARLGELKGGLKNPGKGTKPIPNPQASTPKPAKKLPASKTAAKKTAAKAATKSASRKK